MVPFFCIHKIKIKIRDAELERKNEFMQEHPDKTLTRNIQNATKTLHNSKKNVSFVFSGRKSRLCILSPWQTRTTVSSVNVKA